MQRLPLPAVTGFSGQPMAQSAARSTSRSSGWVEGAQAGLMGSGASRFSALSPPPEHACRAVQFVALCKVAPHLA